MSVDFLRVPTNQWQLPGAVGIGRLSRFSSVKTCTVPSLQLVAVLSDYSHCTGVMRRHYFHSYRATHRVYAAVVIKIYHGMLT